MTEAPNPEGQGSDSAISSFKSRRSRRDFWLFAVATFSFFTTNSMLALLSLVLKEKGQSTDRIGIVLSSPALPILATMLLAGLVITRFGALQVAATGAAVMLLSYLSFEFTIDSFTGAIASRVAHGLGYGLFMPAAMIYADSNLTPKHKIYYFGIYASMLPLPNVLGPFLAETYLRHVGTEQFFFYTALPAMLGAALLFFLTPTRQAALSRSSLLEYWRLLRRRGLWAPYGGVFLVGAFYGFAVSFMALLLQSRDVPVSYFFVTFTLCLFGSRFLLVRYVQRWPREVLFTAGLALLSVSYAMLALIASPAATLAAGVLFGLGYSVAYPTLSVWVAQQFSSDTQGMPLTLYNAVFTLGIFLLPLIGGYVIAWLGSASLVLGLAVTGLAVAGVILVAERAARARALRSATGDTN